MTRDFPLVFREQKCPECGHEQVIVYGRKDKSHFETGHEEHPCPCCGYHSARA